MVVMSSEVIDVPGVHRDAHFLTTSEEKGNDDVNEGGREGCGRGGVNESLAQTQNIVV